MGASSNNKTLTSSFNDLETDATFQRKKLRNRRVNYTNINPLTLLDNQYFPITPRGKVKNKSYKQYIRKTKYLFSKIISLAIQLESGLFALSDYNSEIIKIIDIEKNYYVKDIKAINKISCILEFVSNMILTANEKIIYLWDIRGENYDDDYICYYRGHKTNINILIKYNDKIFASYSIGGKIILWNYNARVIIKKIETYNSKITCIIKLNDGNLCSSGIDSSIKIWDFKNGKCINILEGHKNAVQFLCQFRDGVILSGSKDDTIKAWKNNQCISTLFIKDINNLFIINNNFFAYLSDFNNVKIFDKRTFNCCQELSGTISSKFIKLKNNNLLFYHKSEIIIWKLK